MPHFCSMSIIATLLLANVLNLGKSVECMICFRLE